MQKSKFPKAISNYSLEGIEGEENPGDAKEIYEAITGNDAQIVESKLLIIIITLITILFRTSLFTRLKI